MSASKRVIAVMGATGVQGGSVVRALSALGGYEVRAVTRDPNSAAAQKLASLSNVSFVIADMTDEESLVKAYTGAEVVFAVTNYYDGSRGGDRQEEARQGCRMADAAQKAAVKLFIYSGVVSSHVRSGAQFPWNPITENKTTISMYLKYKKIPHVDLYVGIFMDNWLNPVPVTETKADGTVESNIVKGSRTGQISQASVTKRSDESIQFEQPLFDPNVKHGMSWIAPDVGLCVASILAKYREDPEVLKHPVFCMSGHWTINDVVAEIAKQTGKKVHLVSPTTTGVPDLDNLYEYSNKWGLLSDIPLPDPWTVSLGPKLHTLEEWVRDAAVPYIETL